MDDESLELHLEGLDQAISPCNGCGLCLEGCSTFQLTGWEFDSPRGRIRLANDLLEGRIHPHSKALKTFDQCLGCRRCESFCPVSVSFHKVRQNVQEIRSITASSKTISSMSSKIYNYWIRLAKRMSSVTWRKWGLWWLSYLNPSIPHKKFKYVRTHGDRPSIRLVVSCMQDVFQHDLIAKAISVIRHVGYEVEVDANQPCCGAVFERLINGGDETLHLKKERKKAANIQMKRKKTFLKWVRESDVFLSRGCECTINKGKDLYIWLNEQVQLKMIRLQLKERLQVYYQPYCHFQKIDVVVPLLKQIVNLELLNLPLDQGCCGGYCGESLLRPESASRRKKQLLDSIPSNAIIIVTSPDCWAQLKNENNHIWHPLELVSFALES